MLFLFSMQPVEVGQTMPFDGLYAYIFMYIDWISVYISAEIWCIRSMDKRVRCRHTKHCTMYVPLMKIISSWSQHVSRRLMYSFQKYKTRKYIAHNNGVWTSERAKERWAVWAHAQTGNVFRSFVVECF